MWRHCLAVFLVVLCMAFIKCQFFDCHDDPGFTPDEGPMTDLQFTCLGALQYIHVKKGNPHYFRVPRVVLISRRFALSTAIDAAQVPDGFALGNVIFGDYERDESECHVSVEEIAAGAECEPAVLLMPILDVLLHPEYKHFGAKNSIALLKLLTPVKSNVRRDFIEEEKEVTILILLPRELCYLYDMRDNSTTMTKNRMACTTGCGFHSGAPTVIHEHTGHWFLVALSHGFVMPRASPYDQIAHGWVGHWWMGGLRCYDRGEAADDIFKFYHEIFQIKPITPTTLTYYLEINAAHDMMIICVKVGMPYQLGTPRVWSLDTPEVKVRITLLKFLFLYKFQVEAWGYNATESFGTSPEISSEYN